MQWPKLLLQRADCLIVPLWCILQLVPVHNSNLHTLQHAHCTAQTVADATCKLAWSEKHAGASPLVHELGRQGLDDEQVGQCHSKARAYKR